MGRIFARILESLKSSHAIAIRKTSNMVLTLSNSNMNKKSYEEAINALNGLQSNAATLEKINQDPIKRGTLHEMLQFMTRVGLKVDELDKLKIIHVSGTKGKGSTCAFCESILRSHGFKTGFYSSPHIIEVRERIRINGKPLFKESFADYFWDCYLPLLQSKEENNGLMPAYFRFLTMMAFHVFLQEKVDVAIIEVGIGGQFDCTNIIKHPVVCGVSSLGLDHVKVLGSTIEEIAWNKGGIFKKGVPAITVSQKKEAMKILRSRAYEIGAPLYLTTNLDFDKSQLGIRGSMQLDNASLAVKLCEFWLNDHTKSLNDRIQEHEEVLANSTELPLLGKEASLTPTVINGLKSCKWPGRCQKVVHDGITYYLDGAHTDESFDVCVDWFTSESEAERSKLPKNETFKILWFNLTGGREPELLLKKLVGCDFDCAVFCPNIQSSSNTNSSDFANRMVTTESQINKCLANRTAWMKVQEEYSKPRVTALNCSNGYTSSHKSSNETYQNGSLSCEFYPDARMPTYIFSSIEDTLEWLRKIRPQHTQVLCTGSLHLVGGVLSFIDPEACN